MRNETGQFEYVIFDLATGEIKMICSTDDLTAYQRHEIDETEGKYILETRADVETVKERDTEGRELKHKINWKEKKMERKVKEK
jgi:hypothetical protein